MMNRPHRGICYKRNKSGEFPRAALVVINTNRMCQQYECPNFFFRRPLPKVQT
jgi:hypothetical protein